MEHLLLKAATTATTDQGTFEAVISTPTVDREKDIVEPSAMVDALTKWAGLGKLVPLAWAHTDEVVGHIDPSSVRVENGEVIVKGQVDMAVPRGDETWRLVKSGTLSFSFGYLIPDGGATKRPGGGFHIKELDVFEISVVPVAPANNDTRVLSFKGLDKEAREAATEALAALRTEVEAQNDFANSVAHITSGQAVKALADVISSQVGKASSTTTSELQEVKRRLKALEDLAKDAEETPPVKSVVDPLRETAQKLALEIQSAGLGAQPPRSKQVEPPPQRPEIDPDALRSEARDLMLQVLSGESHESL